MRVQTKIFATFKRSLVINSLYDNNNSTEPGQTGNVDDKLLRKLVKNRKVLSFDTKALERAYAFTKAQHCQIANEMLI